MSNGVTSEVRCIIESFANGLNILSKLRAKHKRRKEKSTRKHNEESTRLSRSLRQGPLDIGHEYERGMHSLGEHYARGDGIAKTSLAEILLRLNAGLVSIIASFLDHNRSPAMDYNSLTSLSESSRRDSLRVLRHMYQRISCRRLPAQISAHGKSEITKQSDPKATKQPKIRGPTIARVTIEDSAKRPQLAVVKPGVKRKSAASSTSNLTKAGSYSSSTTAVNSVLQGRIQSAKSPDCSPVLSQSTTKSNVRPAARSSPGLLPAYAELDTISPPPPRPREPTQLSNRSLNNVKRREVPNRYSIATDSTKLGEIPLHKWAVPYDFDAMSVLNREAMQSGWPLQDLEGNAVYKPKRRFGLLRLFKKKETLA